MNLAGVLVVIAVCANACCYGQATQFFSSNQIAEARSKYPLGPFGRIATNTLEYEDYALNRMLTEANAIAKKWRLDIPEVLTVKDVLFQLNATAFGMNGSVGTRDGRFNWFFQDNRFFSFSDKRYCSKSFLYNDAEMSRLSKVESKITTKEAVEIARNALKQLGYTEQQLKMRRKPEVNQYKFQESDGKTYPLPAFRVTWRKEGKMQYSADNVEYAPAVVEVSGITANVAELWAWEVVQRYNSVIQPAPPPTNYFKMLHLPDNFLETLSERQRALYGLPPLGTNGTVRK